MKAKGKVPPVRGRRRIEKELTALRETLIGEAGEITVKKLLLIDQVIRLQSLILMTDFYLRKTGILDPHAFRSGIVMFQPAVEKTLISFMNTQRLTLAALGLGKEKQDEILSLGKYIEQKDGEKGKAGQGKVKAEQTGGGEGQDKGEGEIVQPKRSWCEISGTGNPANLESEKTRDIEDIGGQGNGESWGSSEEKRNVRE
jgi:hypothetical protein